MKKGFIVTVHILIDAECTAEAQDSISACLSENLQESGAIKDWAYVNPMAEPREFLILDEYEEGDFISEATI